MLAVETPDQPGVRELLEQSSQYHQALYPAESNHLVDVGQLTADNVRFLVARLGDNVIGCGAVVIQHDGVEKWGELKRMWVAAAQRGGGHGRAILQTLETLARQEGVSVLRLETGIRQPEALRLYRASGYQECAPFAGYALDPLSVFMEKRL